jgi:hypothetical protein
MGATGYLDIEDRIPGSQGNPKGARLKRRRRQPLFSIGSRLGGGRRQEWERVKVVPI